MGLFIYFSSPSVSGYSIYFSVSSALVNISVSSKFFISSIEHQVFPINIMQKGVFTDIYRETNDTMKNIRKFNNLSDFQDVYDNPASGYVEPWVSLTLQRLPSEAKL